MTDPNDVIELKGFTGEIATTGGTGHLPLNATTTRGKQIQIDIDDADQCDQIRRTLLSLGTMLKDGYRFNLNGEDDLIMTTPEGKEVPLALTTNNLLALPLRSDNVTYNVTRRLDQVTASFLHELLLHSNPDKIERTLEHTKGYVPGRMPKIKAPGAALGKAKAVGIKRTRPRAQQETVYELNMAEHAPVETSDDSSDDIIDAETVESDSDSDDTESDSDDEATDTVFRRTPREQKPRFNIEALRPWEVSFWDNKDYTEIGVKMRGDTETTLIGLDLASYMVCVGDVPTKQNNGRAFKKIAADEGIPKMPYQCTVYADGCGSMTHVKNACIDLQLRFEPTPPRDSSLNEAEKICNFIWAAARAMIISSRAPRKMFKFAVHYCAYIHNRMATTASRQWKTPSARIHSNQSINHRDPSRGLR